MLKQLVIDHLAKAKRPLIVVLGPTASGKTELSLQVASFISSLAPVGGEGQGEGEIINADSRQLYKYLNIGTAKITAEEMRNIPHHLIDVLDPREEVTVSWYKEQAQRVIDEILARHHVPILVGGSMLYLSSIIDGLVPLPAADPKLRKKLERAYDLDDGMTLHAELHAMDPETAASFDRRNKPYVVRAMEIATMTGGKPSAQKKTSDVPYDLLLLAVSWPKDILDARIAVRTKQLLHSGWIEEVEGLLDRGYGSTDPAMKSHGYKEIMQWLSTEDRNKEELEKVIISKTKKYAKRQMTWWKGDERIHWIGHVAC